MGFYNRYDLFSGCDSRNRCARDYDDFDDNYSCDDFDKREEECDEVNYRPYHNHRQGNRCGCTPWQGKCREENKHRPRPCPPHRERKCCCPICNLINMICK